MEEEIITVTDNGSDNDVSQSELEISNIHSSPTNEAGTGSANPQEANYPQSQVTLLDSSRDVSYVTEGLAVPSEWLEEAQSHPCLELAIKFIDRLSPTGRESPWLITSMTKDLSGEERSDSKDHKSGLAMDIAPMFSADEVLPSDPPMLGLAWNVKSLIVIGQAQWGDIPLFIEGDHLHISTSIKPSQVGELPLMWSTSNFYSSAKQEQNDPLLMKLVNSFWKWDTATLTLTPPSLVTKEWAVSLLR
jgi:hypothetical protein